MKILGEHIAFRENLVFSLRRYRVWWLILAVTMSFDVFTTSAFIDKFGVDAEANLATKLLMSAVGGDLGNVIGKALQLLAVIGFVGLHRRLGNLFLLFVILLNCWAVVINSLSLV
ncbi:MAG: hypothetical protein IH612_19545 [Desulfofustis sp.]|nr:hypothetical protein [Desulfofustis sp.]